MTAKTSISPSPRRRRSERRRACRRATRARPRRRDRRGMPKGPVVIDPEEVEAAGAPGGGGEPSRCSRRRLVVQVVIAIDDTRSSHPREWSRHRVLRSAGQGATDAAITAARASRSASTLGSSDRAAEASSAAQAPAPGRDAGLRLARRASPAVGSRPPPADPAGEGPRGRVQGRSWWSASPGGVGQVVGCRPASGRGRRRWSVGSRRPTARAARPRTVNRPIGRTIAIIGAIRHLRSFRNPCWGLLWLLLKITLLRVTCQAL